MFRKLYGDNPLHLFAQIITLALAGYAAGRVPLESAVWPKMLVWFVGAALGHDLVLYPLYAIADSAAHFRLFRRARPLPHVAGVPWINYLRVPVGLSLLLLLVWWPLISNDAPGTFFAATGLTTDVYLPRWLGITGVFVLVSAVLYAVAVRRAAAAARVAADNPGRVTTP
ncbi:MULTISPECIES: hypothetical protein [unclassified Pseudonocardia]|jgi:hypothetical protein|uniref:hypothetical protein n=1 Tax=unclassified Pseudonocardia TaxID=2619320 RepID=UPI00096532E8|nr:MULTISPECIES: hypothetical protein [unclassified Pseudonocardia]MBN9097661.1 hypothetical protein [Pseudonocardia sp.]OJY39968.1 MAG: hypothetical protein BGP03_22160 [Pseudonocardia sp. 73-21]